MNKYSYTVFGLVFILSLLSLGLFNGVSIWIFILSIFLFHIVDCINESSEISQTFGFRYIGKVLRSVFHSGLETKSLYFCGVITCLLFPVSLYFSLVDRSSLIDNVCIIFLSVFSHLVLDLFTDKAIPLFYFPKKNEIDHAKKYTITNLFSNIILSLSEVVGKISKKNKSPMFARVANMLKGKGSKLNIGHSLDLTDSQMTFTIIPGSILCLYLMYSNSNLFYIKSIDIYNPLISTVMLGIFLLIYTFMGLGDSIKNIITSFISSEDGEGDKSVLLELLNPELLVKLMCLLVILVCGSYHTKLLISNYGDIISRIMIIIGGLFKDWNIIKNVTTFIIDILNYLVF